jgi:hypothetical protein
MSSKHCRSSICLTCTIPFSCIARYGMSSKAMPLSTRSMRLFLRISVSSTSNNLIRWCLMKPFNKSEIFFYSWRWQDVRSTWELGCMDSWRIPTSSITSCPLMNKYKLSLNLFLGNQILIFIIQICVRIEKNQTD